MLDLVTIVHVVGIMDRGGLETFVMNVIRNIDRSRFQCDILCTIPGRGDYDLEAEKLGAKIFNIGTIFQRSTGVARFFWQYKAYKDWFSDHAYDVIHVHGSHALDCSLAVKAALASGCANVICHSHTNDGAHKLLNSLFSIYLCRCDVRRMACSRQAGEWLYGRSGCFEMIKNGIDVGRFSFDPGERDAYRAQLGFSENDKVIAHTGRLVKVKNQSFLIDVASFLDSSESGSWKLLLIGEGDDRNKLQKKVESLRLGGNVLFLGLRDDVPGFLSAADVYVMPSLHEGLPLAAVEAQANGLPALISDGVSPETKLLDTTDILPLESGVESWAHGIACAVNKAERLNSRVEAADAVREAGFDISGTVSQLQQAYALGARRSLRRRVK